jgi:hypothetical protein
MADKTIPPHCRKIENEGPYQGFFLGLILSVLSRAMTLYIISINFPIAISIAIYIYLLAELILCCKLFY